MLKGYNLKSFKCMSDIMSHKLLSLNCIFFYTKKGDYVEVRVGKAAEVTQACYLAILDGDRGSSQRMRMMIMI